MHATRTETEAVIAHLQQQINRLRIYFVAVVAMLGCTGIACVMQAGTWRDASAQDEKKADPVADKITATQLTIVDKKGAPRIRLGTRANDTAPYVCLYSPKGETRVTLLAGEEVSEVVTEYNSRCVLITTEKVLSGIAIGQRKQGTVQHGFRVDDTDEGTILGIKDYDDPDDKHRIAIGKIGKKYDIKLVK